MGLEARSWVLSGFLKVAPGEKEVSVPVSGDKREREERAARNQSLFREINERIEDLNEGFGRVGEWLCECANDTCTERIEMTTKEYEAVRSSGKCFFVAPGDEHVWADVEHVTERNDRYWIVQKVGDAGRLAARKDPRDEGPLPLRT